MPAEVLHAHGLRHAGARLRKDQGADVFELQEILGHASIAVTQVYSERVLEEPQDARGDDVVAVVLPRELRFVRTDGTRTSTEGR